MFEGNMPNKLRLEGGELKMIDGGDVQSYLASKTHMEGKEVVVITREVAERLLNEATLWRLQQMVEDERFALCG